MITETLGAHSPQSLRANPKLRSSAQEPVDSPAKQRPVPGKLDESPTLALARFRASGLNLASA